MTIHDSHIEIHRLVLQQRESLAPGPAFRGSPFQDQEKSRSLEKQREELQGEQLKYAELFRWLGSFEEDIENGKTAAQIRDSWKKEIEAFKAIRAKYLIY